MVPHTLPPRIISGQRTKSPSPRRKKLSRQPSKTRLGNFSKIFALVHPEEHNSGKSASYSLHSTRENVPGTVDVAPGSSVEPSAPRSSIYQQQPLDDSPEEDEQEEATSVTSNTSATSCTTTTNATSLTSITQTVTMDPGNQRKICRSLFMMRSDKAPSTDKLSQTTTEATATAVADPPHYNKSSQSSEGSSRLSGTSMVAESRGTGSISSPTTSTSSIGKQSSDLDTTDHITTIDAKECGEDDGVFVGGSSDGDETESSSRLADASANTVGEAERPTSPKLGRDLARKINSSNAVGASVTKAQDAADSADSADSTKVEGESEPSTIFDKAHRLFELTAPAKTLNISSAPDSAAAEEARVLQHFSAHDERLKNDFSDICSDGVRVFIDWSNLLIGCRETVRDKFHLGHTGKMGYMRFGRVKNLLERGRDVKERHLAGSRGGRYANQQLKEIRETHGYEVIGLERVDKHIEIDPISTNRGRSMSSSSSSSSDYSPCGPSRRGEQCVDEMLQYMMSETMLHGLRKRHRGVMVLATGDGNKAEFTKGGFLEKVTDALEDGWCVELYAFERNIASCWRSKEFIGKWQGRFTYHLLDPFAEYLLGQSERGQPPQASQPVGTILPSYPAPPVHGQAFHGYHSPQTCLPDHIAAGGAWTAERRAAYPEYSQDYTRKLFLLAQAYELGLGNPASQQQAASTIAGFYPQQHISHPQTHSF